jgi:high-affinity nickel-transport protein
MPDIAPLLPLIGLTFMLGLRHGMDPDHLIVVDNITRFNASIRPERARWCGLFFSLGHGATVTLVAALLALAAGSRRIPDWVEEAGQIVSIGFLLAIGLINLRALLREPRASIAPRGVRSGAFLRLTRVSHPLAISMIGAAFAISMDTLSQAAVFSLAASGRFAWSVALLLGGVFTLGMLAVDTANGWWMCRMMDTLAGRECTWMRRLTWTIALFSLSLAAAGLARLGLPLLDAWYDTHALALGVASIVVTSLIFLAALARSQRVRPTR